ncbi:MAG: bile acid:sodium symporter [Bacteroidota bacterium]
MEKLGKWCAIVSGILALGVLLFWIFDRIDYLGPTLILFFIGLALTFNTYDRLKGFSFTILIFAAVAASLFYPQFFLVIGSFKLNKLIVPLLIIIMFGMGTSIGIKDFVDVVKMPKGVLVGLVAQFTIMPFIGFGLAKVSGLPPEVAAGIILVGCSPGGLASNVMAYISGANLALSLTLTAVSTILSPVLTHFLCNFWRMNLCLLISLGCSGAS